MTRSFDIETEHIISIFIENLKPEHKIYMVGGMVRDILLNIPVHDIDFSYLGNVREYAKKVADQLQASFFMLNEKYQTARIIYRSETGKKRWIDIVAIHENDILNDLSQRDFTINAMAIDLEDREKLIDPMNGAKDLKDKILRICKPDSINNDPVRILRAIRLSVQFGWKISKETLNAIKENSEKLYQVSSERKRDELFRIFTLSNSHQALRILAHLNLLKICLPGFYENVLIDEHIFTDQLISSIQKVSQFNHLIIGAYKSAGAMDYYEGEIVLNLGRYREYLSSYFQVSVHPERNIHSLLSFCILFLGVIKKNTKFQDIHQIEKNREIYFRNIIDQGALDLVLSTNEKRWINNFFNGLFYLENALNQNQITNNPEFSYLFFNRSKQSGIAVCLSFLALFLASDKFDIDQPRFLRILEMCKFLMDAYFNHYDEWINPPIFINGHDIKKILELNDGTRIGFWINRIKTETINGKIKSHKDAIQFLVALKDNQN